MDILTFMLNKSKYVSISIGLSHWRAMWKKDSYVFLFRMHNFVFFKAAFDQKMSNELIMTQMGCQFNRSNGSLADDTN